MWGGWSVDHIYGRSTTSLRRFDFPNARARRSSFDVASKHEIAREREKAVKEKTIARSRWRTRTGE